MRIIEEGAKWLSEKTRKAFHALGSKTNTSSSTSKNSRSSLSKSILGTILYPLHRHSIQTPVAASGIEKSIDKAKLERKPVVVNSGGKTYQAHRWIRPVQTQTHRLTKLTFTSDKIWSTTREEANTKPIEFSDEDILRVYGRH